MATDPQTLLAQANCYACYLEMDNLMVLALTAQWVANAATVPIDPVVSAWVARAQANGGHPSTKSITAVNKLWLAIKAAGIDGKMVHLNPIAPDDYATATTPLIVGPGGRNQWGDNLGNLQGQQINLQQGLNGDLTYSQSAGFDTGVLITNTTLATFDAGISVYISVQEPDGTNHTHGGCDDYLVAGTDQFKFIYDFEYVCFSTTNDPEGYAAYVNGGVIAPFAGFATVNAIAGPAWMIAAYGLTNGAPQFPTFTQLPPDVGGGLTPDGSRPTTFTFWWLNGNGQFPEPSAETLSFAAFHHGLTFAQATALFNAVQAYRVSLGAGFV